MGRCVGFDLGLEVGTVKEVGGYLDLMGDEYFEKRWMPVRHGLGNWMQS